MTQEVFGFLTCLYFIAGYVLYRQQFPCGAFPIDDEGERDRLLRTGRRRVLPLPRRREP